jgi:ABC-type nitrate/sulfonate/bicarbonate transport system substrate-binding protein
VRTVGRVLCAAALVLLAGPASAAPPDAVKIGLPGLSIGYAPYYIARDAGFFAKNGIDASFALLADDTLAAGLVSDGIQVTPLAGSITSASLAGFKVKTVGLLVSKLPWEVIARKSVTSLAGLEGKKIITSPPKAAPNVLLDFLLARAGVDPKKVAHLSIGSVAARQQLMLAGRADAIMDDVKSGLQLEAQMPGLHAVVASSAMPDQVGTGVGVSEALIAGNPGLVTRMLRALAEADAFIQHDPDDAATALAKDLKVPPPIARKAVGALIADFSPTLVPEEAVYRNEAALRTMAGGKPVTAAEIRATWDTRLAAAVEQELAGR